MMLSRIGHLAAAGVLLSLAVVPLAGSSQQTPAARLVEDRIDRQGARSDGRSVRAIERHF